MSFIGRFFGFIFVVMGIALLLQGYFAQGNAPALKGIVQSIPTVGQLIAPPNFEQDMYIDYRPYYLSGMVLLFLGIALRLTH